ncbi:penicillin-binding protein [Cellulomonas bogoriensis 69B4 = DSM 16987]|uniref:Penicillin-binding protein n=1 Tax=Cellulomonas bogoriensis 69B4 = DSM 16987 TaxID=1386082 RepID=A0A0A0BQ23_9CELL|nr:penicillin-binding protein [Cellulomonas bogoriensis 69B4 = DSM 16987]
MLVAVALTACTGERPGPEGEAADLAQALSTGAFAQVAFTDATHEALATGARQAVYDDVDPFTPQVTVQDVTVQEDDEDQAVATLRATWDLGTPEPWTYTVQADLVRGGDPEDRDAWQVVWSPGLLAPDLTDGEVLETRRVRAERGTVLGADDTPIVVDRPVHRVGIDKTLGDPATHATDARALATALDMDADAYADRVAAAGERAFVEAIVVRDEDPTYDVDELTTGTSARAVPDTLPLAPTRTFARPVLGTVGEATAEIIEASDGAVAAGDMAGLSGLQARYDELLRGTPGLTVRATSPDSDEPRTLYEVAPVDGDDLRTTLDIDLQTEAETVLADVEPASAIVAIRPSTGDILAVASGPGSDGASTATVGQYPPGSVFKVVSGLAWLRSGATPDTLVACPSTISVDGRTFQNFPGYPVSALGQVPLSTAMAHSCNTAFIGARDDVPADALAEAAAGLGLTGQGDLGFSAFLGEVPDDVTGTSHAAAMIGQGQVLTSPLGMATVAASVANGSRVTPRLLVDHAPTNGTPPPVAAPVTAAEAEDLHALMRSVVTEGGATFLADLPGGDVAAKTGTAQFGAEGQLQNHTWMIATQGDLAVAVFVEVGEYGSTTAGPLLEAFLRPPD